MQNPKHARKEKVENQSSLFISLKDTLDPRHPLCILAQNIEWAMFDREFSKHYCADSGCPAKAIRLMTGLLILKQLRNSLDESVAEQWGENIYDQYFCDNLEFVACAPFAASDLIHFRHRIGEARVEFIVKESIRINGDDIHDPNLTVVTTVQDKSITFPADDVLQRKIIDKCLKMADKIMASCSAKL